MNRTHPNHRLWCFQKRGSTNSQHQLVAAHAAFTLPEVLIAMLITSILVLGINGAHRQARRLWLGAENPRPAFHSMRLLTDTLRTELSGVYLPAVDSNDASAAFELSRPRPGQVELTFLTHTPAWETSLQASRPARLTYRYVANEASGSGVLKRAEQLFAGAKALGPVHEETILMGLSEFQVLVADPNGGENTVSWIDTFQARGTLPRALKLKLAWPHKDPALDLPTRFETSFLVPCQEVLK